MRYALDPSHERGRHKARVFAAALGLSAVDWRRLLWAGGIGATAVLLLTQSNRWYYERDQSWSNFIKYNGFRGQIHGTPLTIGIPQAVARVGWTKNDGELFRSFYFAEPEVYASSTKVELLLNPSLGLASARQAKGGFKRGQPDAAGSLVGPSIWRHQLLPGSSGRLQKRALPRRPRLDRT